MSSTVEQLTEEALALPSEARALLADRLVESLDPAEDGYIRQLWVKEALKRRDDTLLVGFKQFQAMRLWLVSGRLFLNEI